jgi:2-polyprenyl-3-methyl-5-hydroxy-6-metoxy-1,4-benzoquinol methylase
MTPQSPRQAIPLADPDSVRQMNSSLPQDLIESKRTRHESKRTFGQADVDALADLLREAKAAGPVAEIKDMEPRSDGFIVALRHDVDHDLENAIAFAELEARLGVRSTYYLLHTDWYYRSGVQGPPSTYLLEAAARIAELGHEIAVHNNAITMALKTGGDPIEILSTEIDYLRREGFDVRGTVAHGDQLCHQLGYVNYEVFTEMPRSELGAPDREIAFTDKKAGATNTVRLMPIPMSELGLDYEANRTPRTISLSDSDGALSIPWKDLKVQLSAGDIVHVLAHPIWWALGSEAHTPRMSPREREGSRIVAAKSKRRGAIQGAGTSVDATKPEASSSSRESGYDKRYAEGGFGYAKNHEKWVKWTDRHYIKAFRLQPGETLLDVGCGDGFWTSLFAAQGFDCTGMDLSATGIETAKRLYGDSEFFIGDAEKPLFNPPRQFDIVFCRTISHLCMKPLMNSRTLATMANMSQCVAPGGIFLLSYNTLRNHENAHACADHKASDLMTLVEPFLDPFRFELVGNYIQIGAQRRDARRSKR